MVRLLTLCMNGFFFYKRIEDEIDDDSISAGDKGKIVLREVVKLILINFFALVIQFIFLIPLIYLIGWSWNGKFGDFGIVIIGFCILGCIIIFGRRNIIYEFVFSKISRLRFFQ